MMILMNIALFLISIFSFAIGFPSRNDIRTNSEQNIKRLKKLGPNDLAEELSGQFEGDIVISKSKLNEIFESGMKTGLIDEIYRWANNTIPYRINSDDFNLPQIEHIQKAVHKLEEVTCLTFIPYNPEAHNNFVWVTGETSGCWSSVGMQGGQQQLNLQPYDVDVGCFRLYTIIHEFIHALGFYHMQSATERDDYVDVIWKNIQQGHEHNFNKYDSNMISLHDIEYDYESVMHYSDTAFSVNGEKTIKPIKELEDGVIIGQRNRLTEKDIARINAMYCK